VGEDQINRAVEDKQLEVRRTVESRPTQARRVVLLVTSTSTTLSLIKRRSEREINTYYLLLTIVLIFSTLFTQ
jgi:hypothetical protein